MRIWMYDLGTNIGVFKRYDTEEDGMKRQHWKIERGKFQSGYFRNLKMAKWGCKRSETQTNAMIRKHTQNIWSKSNRKSCVSLRLWHTKSLQKSFFFSLEIIIKLSFNALNSCTDVNRHQLQAVNISESLQNPSRMLYLAHIADLLGTRVTKAVIYGRMIYT